MEISPILDSGHCKRLGHILGLIFELHSGDMEENILDPRHPGCNKTPKFNVLPLKNDAWKMSFLFGIADF